MFLITSKCFITVDVDMAQVIRCHRLNMKTSIINGSKVSKLSVAIHCSSPYHYQGVSSGRKFKQAVLKFYRINYNGQEEEYFRVTMDNVRINEIEPFMFDIKNPTFEKHNHLEAFYLAYEKITWHYLDGNIIHSDSWNGNKEAA
ncbi:type VI secretion system tube protein Hcp [Citrobacter freundii]|nr:type VI secretion system tube protein Hcp [Citrobacter freundii]